MIPSLILIAILVSMSQSASAGCTCGSGNWNPSTFLNYEPSGLPGGVAIGQSQAQDQPYRSDSFVQGVLIKSMPGVSSTDVVLDVSDGDVYRQQGHIKRAVNLPWKNFLNGDDSLKDATELASILGQAGVSRTDPTVVYGNDLEETAFVFWVLSYLGQEELSLLDGDFEEWRASGLPVEVEPSIRQETDYVPLPKIELRPDYYYIISGEPQILDSRSFQDFSQGRIVGAAYFDSEKLLENGRIKDGDQLAAAFDGISKENPVVVYSDDYTSSALVWYALQLMGYDSSIYSWADWTAHQPEDAGKEESTGYMKLGTT